MAAHPNNKFDRLVDQVKWNADALNISETKLKISVRLIYTTFTLKWIYSDSLLNTIKF